MRAAIFILALAAAAVAQAEPRAKSAEECMTYADLALVASTLAKHGIARERAHAMIPDMYNLRDADAAELARRIVEAAYLVPEAARTEPRTFASNLGSTCLRAQGRMDAVIGVKL
jgi:hypothetical protein